MLQRLAYPIGITAEKAQQHAESLHIEGDLLQRTGLFQIDQCIVYRYDLAAVEAHMTDAVPEL